VSPSLSKPGNKAHWGVKVLGLLLLLVACTSAYYLGSYSQTVAWQNEGLVIQPAALDFGEVWENKSFSWKVPIENRAAAPTEIAGFVTSCGCPRLRESPERSPDDGSEHPLPASAGLTQV